MANPDCSGLLDQLQSQINLVVCTVDLLALRRTDVCQLEQAGRVFAAVDTTGKRIPTAQVNKLKQIIPRAQNNFHDALDLLEDELVSPSGAV